MNDKCPYCNKIMQKGIIHRDRYNLKWIPKDKDRGVMFSPFVKGIKLTSFNERDLDVYHCERCKKMIFETP